MKELQSILLENIEISLPGLSVRRVALNQHMPRVEKLSEHCHDYHQWLLYLRGRGEQQIQNRSVEVGRGSVLWIEAGIPHRFIKESEVRPLCLVVDFEATDPGCSSRLGVMSASALADVEKILVEIHEEEQRALTPPLGVAALILQLLSRINDTLTEAKAGSWKGPVVVMIEKIISRSGVETLSPRRIAEACGCTLDHLNRQAKNECGKTVGGLLNESRVKVVTEMLAASSDTIGEIGAKVGMDDQNYFSRWFRKQTGKTPSQWRILHRN
ncbi:MAG: helix-turn-helix domain-containing protein [Verrucomicrobiota bacterium]